MWGIVLRKLRFRKTIPHLPTGLADQSNKAECWDAAQALCFCYHMKGSAPMKSPENSMKSGRCPNCGSTNVHMQRNGMQANTGWVMKTTAWGGHHVDEEVEIFTYLCVYCGYFENYLLDREKLSLAANKWARVSDRH